MERIELVGLYANTPCHLSNLRPEEESVTSEDREYLNVLADAIAYANHQMRLVRYTQLWMIKPDHARAIRSIRKQDEQAGFGDFTYPEAPPQQSEIDTVMKSLGLCQPRNHGQAGARYRTKPAITQNAASVLTASAPSKSAVW
jgi:hypothetical protein